MALKPHKDDPNYESEKKRSEKEPEKFNNDPNVKSKTDPRRKV